MKPSGYLSGISSPLPPSTPSTILSLVLFPHQKLFIDEISSSETLMLIKNIFSSVIKRHENEYEG